MGDNEFLKAVSFRGVGVEFILLEQFSVHSKAEKKVYRFPAFRPHPPSAAAPDGALVTVDGPVDTSSSPQSTVYTTVALDHACPVGTHVW